MIKGEKATEAAAPFEMDLQLFAEDETGTSATADNAATDAATDNNAGETGDDDGHELNIGEKQDMFDGTAPESQESKPDPVPDQVKKEQSPEANAAFAEMRRRNEALEKEIARRDADIEGLKSYRQQQEQEQLQRQQQDIKTKPAQVAQQTYQQLIQQGYDDAVAREVANARGAAVEADLKFQSLQGKVSGLESQTKQQQEQAAKQQQEQAAKQIFQSWEADRKALKEEYGDLVPDNFTNLDPEIVRSLKGGVSFKQAWTAANIDKVVDLAKGKGAQKAVKEINSKAHLDSEKGGGSGVGKQVHVSDEKLQVWRALGYSDKEARQKEARYQRRKQG